MPANGRRDLILRLKVNAVSLSLYARERDQLPIRGAWVGPRASLDATENLAPTVVRTLNRPACSESLCRLSNPGRIVLHNNVNIIDTDLTQLVGASVRLRVTCHIRLFKFVDLCQSG